MARRAHPAMRFVAALTILMTLSVCGAACSLHWPFRRHAPQQTVPLPVPLPVVQQPPPVEPPVSDGPPAGTRGGVIDRRYAVPIVTSAPSGWKRVALTFDAGWEYELTPKLLDLLDQQNVKATFFLRGAWIHDHPDLARDIAARGHEIESHSYTHPDMTKLTDEEMRGELDREGQAFRDVLSVQPTFFRPPFGAWNKSLLERLGERGFRGSIMWTVDTLDYTNPGVETVVARAGTAKDGSIILMHVGAPQTIEALPRIIEALRQQGLEPVTVRQLLGEWLAPEKN